MKNGKTIGMILFFGGIILLVIYGLYLGFEELMQALDIVTGTFIGIILIGFIVLLVSIVIEQRKGTKKMKEKISKEDLEP